MSAPEFRPAAGMLAAEALERANKFAAGGMSDVARMAGRQALRYLLDAFGLGHSEQALVEVLVNGQEGHDELTDYDLAHLRGDVKVEVEGEERILSLSELRALIRRQNAGRTSGITGAADTGRGA